MGLLLLLVLLVVFAPTIAGTAWARNIVLSRVNANLNGRLEVADWSLGWGSGLKLSGVRLLDASNAQVLELKSLTTQLTLLDAIRGRYHVGKVVVDGLDVLIKTDAEGNTNLEKIAATDPAAQTDEPTEIPDLRGELHLVNCRATYEDGRSPENGGTGQTFYFPSIAGEVKFPDINAAIENAIDVTVKVGDEPPGSITLAGTFDIIENNVVRLEQATIDQKAQLAGLELASLTFALGTDSGIQTLSGVSDGVVVARMQQQGDATLEIEFTTRELAVGGPALSGDTYRTETLALTAPSIIINRSAAPDDISQWTIRAGSEEQPVQLKVDQGTVTITADTPVQAIQNLAANLAPGAAGFVRLNLDVDAAALQRQLPHVIDLREGLRLTSGRIQQAIDLTLKPDRADLRTFDLNITEIAGRDESREADFSLEPIHVTFTGSSLGGGQAIPDLRDLKLSIESAFANGGIEGRSIAETNGKLTADLASARDELAKLMDLDDAEAAGTLVLGITSKGDFITDKRATVGVSLVGNNLKLSGIPDMPALSEPRLRVDTSMIVIGGEDQFLRSLQELILTAKAGDEQRPTLDAEVVAESIDLSQTAPAPEGTAPPATAPAAVVARGVELKRMLVHLAEAQAKYGDLVPALQEMALQFDGGTVNITGSGGYDGTTATYTTRVELANATLNKTPVSTDPQAPPQPPRQVLQDYSLAIGAAGNYVKQDDQRARITLTTLAGEDNRGTSFARAGEREFVIALTPEGIAPSGALTLGADLKHALDVVTALGDEPTPADADQTGLRSGKLGGTVQVQPFEAGQFRVVSDLKLTELTVVGESGEALKNEQLAIDLQVRPRSDLSAIEVDRLNVNGRLVTLNTATAKVQLTVGEGEAARSTTLPEMVQALQMTAKFPDMGQIQTLLDAFASPEAPVAAGPAGPLREQLVLAQEIVDPDAVISRPADRPEQPREPEVRAPEAEDAEEPSAPPTRFTGGSMSVALTVAREGERYVWTPNVTGKDVAIAKGEAASTIEDLSFNTAMSYVPVAPTATADAPAPTDPAATQPADPSLAELVRDVQVPELELSATSGGAPIVNLSLAEPIAVSDPAGLADLLTSFTDPAAVTGDVPTVRTALTGGGDIGELVALLKTLQADASTDRPYAGTYRLDQKFAAGAEGIAASGTVIVLDFSAKGENATLTEKSIRLANDVSLNASQKVLSIRNVSLAMEATKALELTLKGAIHDFDTARRLEGVEGTIGYDWAKVWQMVEPMLDEETREGLVLEVAGQGSERFWFTGSLPADQPFNEAVRSLAGGLQVHFDGIDYEGLAIRGLQLPLTLEDGIATIAFADKTGPESVPPPAECNGGTLNIGGAAFDLTGELTRLNIPSGQKLLDNVTLNPVFSDRFGDTINNPAFINPSEAAGVVNVTVVQCDQLPLGTLEPRVARRDPGRAEFLVSMTKLQLGNPMIAQVAKWAGQEEFVESLHGEIREARIVFEKGQTKQDITIATGEKGRQLRFAGATDLSTSALDLTVTIGPQFLSQLGSDVVKALPQGLPVPLTGTTRAPRFDMQRALTAAVGENLIPNLIDRLARPRGRDTAPDGTAPQDPADPVGGLLDDLLGKKKETDREKEERRAKRRREREQQNQTAPEQPGASDVQGDDAIGRPADKRRRDRDRRR